MNKKEQKNLSDVLLESYLQNHEIRKLHIGAATSFLDSWLNTDILPIPGKSTYLDATTRFPFDDSTFDYVFSEHMIEHLTYDKGLFMLSECYRILKYGGMIRIATPNLAALIDLYKPKQGEIQQRYIKWITEKFLPEIKVYKASFVINNAFYNWGHQFLYDQDLLYSAMEKVGFVDIKSCPPGQSSQELLDNIEAHGKTIEDEELNKYETIVLEGKCLKQE